MSVSPTEGLGARIREARLKKGLTQSELAGDDVTRNMLSRIENGAALPSLPTLCAIAGRLGVPPGELLGEAEDYRTLRLTGEFEALASESRFDEILSRREEAGEKPSAYLSRLLYEACVGAAEKRFREGKLAEASELLKTALEYDAGSSPAADRAFLLERLTATSPTAASPAPPAPDPMFREMIFGRNQLAVWLWARQLMSGAAGKAYSVPDENAAFYESRLRPLIENLPSGVIRSHLEARLDMVHADYLGAKAKLLPLTADENGLPPTVLYELYQDLELCCKCCGDFENAYKYAGVKLDILKELQSRS